MVRYIQPRRDALLMIPVVLVGLLGLAPPALAGDAKVMMGGSCLPLLTSTSTYNPWTATRMYAVNAHTAALSYSCMLTRDNETATTGLANATASVYTPAGATTQCTLKSLDKYQTAKDSFTVSVTAGDAAIKSDLRFDANIDVSVDGGAYGLACTLAPGARVYTYRYTEN